MSRCQTLPEGGAEDRRLYINGEIFIARQQDESTGYVLPNKALIGIAKKMPTTTEDLRRIVKSKYPVVEDNFDLILDIVWNATENSNAFEAIAEQLKKVQLGQLDLKNILDHGLQGDALAP